MHSALLVLLVGLVAIIAGCVTTNAARGPAAAPALPALKVEPVCAPVVTSRMFSSGLAPNARGGWTFIAELMNYNSTWGKPMNTIPLPSGQHYLAFQDTVDRPEAEWVVADLQTGQYQLLNWPGYHSNQPCLAPNGRLFFPVDYAQLYYYDPTADTVKPLARVCDDVNELRSFYRLLIGPDNLLYGSAQGGLGQTTLLRLNPDTLEYQVYPKVGLPGRRAGLTYGYYLAVDPPWMYVAVGQGNWELFAVNADTGEQRCLADVTGDGCRVICEQRDYCTAQLIRPGKHEVVWLVDGKAIPVEAGKKPEATPIPQKKYRMVEWKNTKPMDLSKPPELNGELTGTIDEKGASEVVWRPAGGAGEWKQVPFAIKRAEPVRIESLIALPDGSLFGNAYQYNGFFRYYPATGKLDYFGKFPPSRPCLALADAKVYFNGYPNTMMLVYDPAQPWTAKPKTDGKAPGDNPKWLGTMGQGCAEAHYCKKLVNGSNGRVYMMGLRERWSTGTGLGYYEPATNKFFGLGRANKELDPMGLVVLPKLGRVVFSGNPNQGTDTRLVVYDLDLKELERITIRRGLASGGVLFPADTDTAFYGSVQDPASKRFLLYRYDLATKKLIVKRQEVTGGIEMLERRLADGTWWAIADGAVQAFDPQTLQLKPRGRIPGGINYSTWVGRDLYGARGGELIRVTVP